jgi:F-type H+-transporting ATPase subunit delta
VTGALATHYARALADAVLGPNSDLTPEQALEQLQNAESVLTGSQLLKALLSPAVNKKRKSAIVSRLSDELGFHRLIRNFLMVVLSHGRTKELHTIREQFESVVDERLGWVPGEITSAQELTAAQKQEVERVLGTRLGKFIRAHYRIDPDLLGGIRARVASRQYDASLRGRLEGMRQKLAAGL